MGARQEFSFAGGGGFTPRPARGDRTRLDNSRRDAPENGAARLCDVPHRVLPPLPLLPAAGGGAPLLLRHRVHHEPQREALRVRLRKGLQLLPQEDVRWGAKRPWDHPPVISSRGCRSSS